MLRTDSLNDLLEDALADGALVVGQVLIERQGDRVCLRHVDDSANDSLRVLATPQDVQDTVRYDESGAYRPLKTAPNLRRGWTWSVSSLPELRLALDTLYPAALGNWRAVLRSQLEGTPLRQTVNRQTGMYRITGKITDEQASDLVETLCTPGCLRHRLWTVNSPVQAPAPVPGRIPLLCAEACCLVIAAARKVVKGIPLDQVE